jgi:hypothetical protein
MGIASQEFRDGAATGAAQLARRIRIVESFGIPITSSTVDLMAQDIVSDWGGAVHPQDQWLAAAETPREADHG